MGFLEMFDFLNKWVSDSVTKKICVKKVGLICTSLSSL